MRYGLIAIAMLIVLVLISYMLHEAQVLALCRAIAWVKRQKFSPMHSPALNLWGTFIAICGGVLVDWLGWLAIPVILAGGAMTFASHIDFSGEKL